MDDIPEFVPRLAEAVLREGSLWPASPGSPYYVVTPPYVRTSAGVRCMHLLIHWLNRVGYQAYAYIPPEWADSSRAMINGDLQTPELN